MVPRIRIITFGSFQIFRGDYAVTERDWHTRQARQLLKILLTERPRPVASDRLIEILWPDSVPAAAATTLRSAINALRNVLEPDRPNRAPSRYVITRTPGYAFELHPDIWIDVAAFERELAISRKAATRAERRDHLQAALNLYQDDYLSTDRYADWAAAERERLQELYFDALLQRADLDAQTGDFTDAIAAARSILARDPVREIAYQALMRYQATAGDSAGALLTFERCRSVLADELGADPNPLTRRLHQAILNGDIDLDLNSGNPLTGPATAISATTTPAAPVLALPSTVHLPKRDPRGLPVFVGRADDLARLQQAIAALGQGHGSQRFIIGEAGAGKSRLLHHFLHRLTGPRTDIAPDTPPPRIILSTTCHPLFQALPFAPIADLIGTYLTDLPQPVLAALPATTLAEISRILPQIRDRLPNLPDSPTRPLLDAPTRRLRIAESCAAFFTTLAAAHPTVLAIDDLQWADADTLAVLQLLNEHSSSHPLLILGALRSDDMTDNQPLRTFMHTLERTTPDAILSLSPLVPDDIDALLTAAQETIDATVRGDLAAMLYNMTQGNPLFLTEALLDRREAAANQSDMAETAAALPQNRHVQAVVQERLQRLPPAAHSVLQAAATIGRDFDAELLEAATPVEPAAWLDLLLQRQFLIELPDARFDFRHDLVRRVIAANTNPLQRRRNHLAVAVALEALGRASQVPDELAYHYRQAGARHSSSFVHYSITAGEAALQALGFTQAADHFEAALTALAQHPELPPEFLRRALAGMGLVYEGLGDPAGVSAAYQRLVLWAEAHGDRPLLLTTHSRLVAVLALLGRQQASHHALRDLRAALATPHIRGTQALHDLVARRYAIYRPDTPLAYTGWTRFTLPPTPVMQAANDLPKLIAPEQASLPLLDYAQVLLMQGQLDEATQILSHLRQPTEATPQPLLHSAIHHQLGTAARMGGDTDQARIQHEQALEFAESLPAPMRHLAGVTPRLALAALALQEAQFNAAAAHLQATQAVLDQHTQCYNYRHSTNILLGLLALQQGDFVQAGALLETAVADPFNLSPYTYVRGLLGLARMAYLQQQPAISSRYLRRALAFAGQRSLLDEYIAALQTAVHLQPADAPLLDLIESAQTFTTAASLDFFSRTLQDAARRVETSLVH